MLLLLPIQRSVVDLVSLLEELTEQDDNENALIEEDDLE